MAAGDVTTFAFVFDMNHLFEAFTVNFIRRHRYDILPVELRPCDCCLNRKGRRYTWRNEMA